MSRIEGQRGASTSASRSSGTGTEQRIAKELAGGAMLAQARLLRLVGERGASATTCRYFQVAAKLYPDELRGLAELARRSGLDLRRCGPELALYAPRAPRDLLQRAPTATPTTAEAPGKQLERVLARTGDGELERAFYRGGDHGFTSLQALGQLGASEVCARAGANADRLATTAFSAFRGLVAGRVQAAVGKALAQLKPLLADAQARRAFLAALPTAEARAKALRAVGVDGETARRLGATPTPADGELRAALGRASEALDTLHRWGTRGVLREEVAVGLFAAMRPVVDELRRELGVQKGSFLDEAIAGGLRKGEAILKRDAVVKVLCGIACSLVLGGLGAPAAAGKAAVYGTAIAQKALKAAVFEGQALGSAHHQAGRVGTAEGLGLADRTATARAESERSKQWVRSLAGLALDGAGVAWGSTIKDALGARLLEHQAALLQKLIGMGVSVVGKQGIKAEANRAPTP
jgi:hypothetical protein